MGRFPKIKGIICVGDRVIQGTERPHLQNGRNTSLTYSEQRQKDHNVLIDTLVSRTVVFHFFDHDLMSTLNCTEGRYFRFIEQTGERIVGLI